MKRTLLIINGECSHGKTSLVKHLIAENILTKETATFTSDSKQELGRSPEYVLKQIQNHLRLHPDKEIITLTLRHLPFINKCEYYGYEYVDLLLQNMEFDKAIIVSFNPNPEKFSDEQLCNIHANITNINTLCNFPSAYKSFDYVKTKAEVEHKIKEATEFIIENLNKSI